MATPAERFRLLPFSVDGVSIPVNVKRQPDRKSVV